MQRRPTKEKACMQQGDNAPCGNLFTIRLQCVMSNTAFVFFLALQPVLIDGDLIQVLYDPQSFSGHTDMEVAILSTAHLCQKSCHAFVMSLAPLVRRPKSFLKLVFLQ